MRVRDQQPDGDQRDREQPQPRRERHPVGVQAEQGAREEHRTQPDRGCAQIAGEDPGQLPGGQPAQHPDRPQRHGDPPDDRSSAAQQTVRAQRGDPEIAQRFPEQGPQRAVPRDRSTGQLGDGHVPRGAGDVVELHHQRAVRGEVLEGAVRTGAEVAGQRSVLVQPAEWGDGHRNDDEAHPEPGQDAQEPMPQEPGSRPDRHAATGDEKAADGEEAVDREDGRVVLGDGRGCESTGGQAVLDEDDQRQRDPQESEAVPARIER